MLKHIDVEKAVFQFRQRIHCTPIENEVLSVRRFNPCGYRRLIVREELDVKDETTPMERAIALLRLHRGPANFKRLPNPWQQPHTHVG